MSAPAMRWIVGADDRTGAFDVAGELAATLGPVAIRCATEHGLPSELDTLDGVVVDLNSRHATPERAAELAAALPTIREGWNGWNAHKIDSQLRGNWAVELVARHAASGLRVLLIPAWPALGRICVDGAVLVHGVPVAEGPAGADPRSPVRSSHPAEHLRGSGATDVATLRTLGELDAWLNATTTGAPFAVCDASTEAEVDAIAARWSAHTTTVLLAGPGGPIGAGARAVAGSTGPAIPTPAPDFGSEWLILCGSLHPMARRQIAEFAQRFPGVPIVASERVNDGSTVAHADAHTVATSLAAQAIGSSATTVVVIGGDTAAALIGDTPWTVWGAADAGLPYGRATDGTGPWVITKAGGFGADLTLVDLYTSFFRHGATA